MTLPNFVLIGASKAGTSSLANQLGQHPQVFMSPNKEPMFFALHAQSVGRNRAGALQWEGAVSTWEEYQALFDGVTDETAIGEASTVYLALPGVAEAIQRHLPDARLIAILRDPSARALSAHAMCVGMGIENVTDFSEAIREEGPSTYWRPYLRAGLYFEQLERYYRLFDPNQILVLLYDDFLHSPTQVLDTVFRFLGVSDRFVPNTSVWLNPNPAATAPRSKALDEFMNKSHPLKALAKALVPASLRSRAVEGLRKRNQVGVPRSTQRLTATDRRFLVEFYRDDILKLEALLQRDLATWLEPSPPA